MIVRKQSKRWSLQQATVTQQLILGFGLVLFCMIVTLSIDVAASFQQNVVTNHLVSHLYPARRAAHQMITLARVIDNDGARYLMARDPQQGAQLLRDYQQEVNELQATLNQAMVLADTSAQRQAVTDFKVFFFVQGGYYDTSQYAFSQFQTGRTQDAYATYFGSPLDASLEQDIETYTTISDKEISHATTQEHMAGQLVMVLSIGCGIGATLFTVGIALVITRSIRKLHLEIEKKNRELTEASAQLEMLATVDPLTGLPNRRTFMEHIDAELLRCDYTQEQSALLFIDVDHFKRINDTWGHQAGDMVLCNVAQRLSNFTRESDFVGRYGGEEFVALLTSITFDEARAIAERLRTALIETHCQWPRAQDLVDIPITASIGGAIYPLHGQSSVELIEAADSIMYHVKHTGRNRVCFVGEGVIMEQEARNQSATDSEERRPILNALPQ